MVPIVQVRILAAERFGPVGPPKERAALASEMVGRPDGPVPALTDLSDAWLIARSRELAIVAQHSELSGQIDYAREIDDLLAEAQRRGEPWLIGEILRSAVIIRLLTPGISDQADPLLAELLAHTRRHGLLVLEADAHALAGRKALMAHREDTALSEIALALAMLDVDITPDALLHCKVWDRLLASALVEIGFVLTQLGVYELADRVLARAHHCVRSSGGPHDIVLHLLNRVRLLVSWGFHLERVHRVDEAKNRFATAAAIAAAAEEPLRESLFSPNAHTSAAARVPVLAAAHALVQPASEHIARLSCLLTTSGNTQDLIITGIALSRCLVTTGQPAAALSELSDIKNRLQYQEPEHGLRLCLIRELAIVSSQQGKGSVPALMNYTTELEQELWGLAETRGTTFLTRLAHERLSRQHDAVERQARQDPLTGLPNRRALEERMPALYAIASAYPLSVALIDLDGFKAVNDRYSHAEGDNVLRVIAGAVRDALRSNDVVTRYGGDEFVVLLPGAPLPSAKAALNRAVDAVNRLPFALSRGVTLSVGVVAVYPPELPDQTLSRADTAMYRAKRQGGNRVFAGNASSEKDQ